MVFEQGGTDLVNRVVSSTNTSQYFYSIYIWSKIGFFCC